MKLIELTDRPPLPDDPHARWRVAAAAPRNKGLELAQGEWITHLDDDDEFTPNHIAVLLQKAHVLQILWRQGCCRLRPMEGIV